MKIRVVIVEDEPAIGRALRAMITQVSEKFEVVGMAYNGLEGLDLIKEHKPQIVFTDIRMPFLDGLEMIERAKNEFTFPVKYILLTGYSEFSYAQRAVRLGAADYLLKPLEFEALERLLCEMEKENHILQEKIKEDYIRRCLRSLQEISDLENPFIYCDCYLLFSYYGPVIHDMHLGFTIGNEAVQNLDFGFLKNLEEEFQVSILPVRGIYHNEIVYMLYAASLTDFPMECFVERFYSEIQAKGTYTNLIVSQKIREGKGIPSAILECNFNLLFGIPFGYGKVLYCKRISGNKPVAVSPAVQCISHPQKARLITYEYLAGVVRSLISNWKEQQCSQIQLQMDIRYFLDSITTLSEEKDRIILPDIPEIISDCDSYEDLEYALLYETCILFHIKNDTGHLETSKALMHEVKAFLESNYTCDLSYKDFYDKFGYNEKYISALYKEEFGITPNKYMIQLRITAAKLLLKEHPNMLLKDVALQTGYEDALYFSRIFKSYVGVSPSIYQKNIK